MKLESASKQTTQVVSSHPRTPLGVGTSHGHFGPQDSPWPGLGGSHHLPPYSILCDAPLRLHPNGSFSRDSQVGVPKLSRNCPGWSPGTLGAHTLDCRIGSRRGPNQTCSRRRGLSNDVSHSQLRGWEDIDSQLLVVGSQTASLTPDPSFAHNLGCRCANQECEGILDIYASRPFQWFKEHLRARCCGPSNRLLSFWESRRTLNSHFREWEFDTPTLG